MISDGAVMGFRRARGPTSAVTQEDEPKHDSHKQVHEQAARHVSRVAQISQEGAPHQPAQLVPEAGRVVGGRHQATQYPLAFLWLRLHSRTGGRGRSCCICQPTTPPLPTSATAGLHRLHPPRTITARRPTLIKNTGSHMDARNMHARARART
jgi:hypothetical protein